MFGCPPQTDLTFEKNEEKMFLLKKKQQKQKNKTRNKTKQYEHLNFHKDMNTLI